ncbi:AfsR/SARP family transcriptional regulator [Nonomuraea typhae]|uniref:AfsR/SARP family transcriptional regulator n=1 Tax=Nonomuraea typhae TaxID=2603600 RepID=UPI0012FC1471|nr:BTAD domain-containing putative transcriptional regulator [Nonomuraea typhae]
MSGVKGMRFRLLGSLQVVSSEGKEVRIGRRKVRQLLALLLTSPNNPVSVDSLAHELWGADPPDSALLNLRTYVCTLRKLLSAGDPAQPPVRTRSHGYLIDIPPDHLDTVLFDRLVTDGAEARRRENPQLAAKHFEHALNLWRGRAYQDTAQEDGALATAAKHLHERRLLAVEQLFDVRLTLGHHAETIGELERWAERHPLRERLWSQLMLALYRAGRQADALAAFQRLRARSVEDLGMEPSASLSTLQAQILRADPALSPRTRTATSRRSGIPATPRQLPPDVPAFVGRGHELATLREWFTAGRPDGPGPMAVVHGPPGAGKSALAVRAANTVAASFPDGQLYADLGGSTPGMEPQRPLKVLGRFLRSLGVPGVQVPDDEEEASSLFRSLTADRKVLILLDNAVNAAHVRPLLPGRSSSGVLITSRNRLPAVPGAAGLALRPLGAGTSYAMLAALIGEGRAAAHPPATARLAGFCEHLPLALSIAASRLNSHPDWPVQRLADRLADERRRLGELATGEVSLSRSMELSFIALRHSGDPRAQAAAHVLSLVSLTPMRQLDTAVVAALLGVSQNEADQVLERLLDAHLVEPCADNRYRPYELVRILARELAGDAPSAARRRCPATGLLRAGRRSERRSVRRSASDRHTE